MAISRPFILKKVEKPFSGRKVAGSAGIGDTAWNMSAPLGLTGAATMSTNLFDPYSSSSSRQNWQL